MYLLYSLLLSLGILVAGPYWLFQRLRHHKYRAGFAQRFGSLPSHLRSTASPHTPSIWIHAVSVGEVLAITPLVAGLRSRFPAHRILVSTTTAAGNRLAGEKFGVDSVFYFPLDFAFAIRPYLRALRPQLVIIAETEFWPNFLRLASDSGATLAVVNARISDRSFPRYRGLRVLFAPLLSRITLFLCQTNADRDRLIAIGAPPGRVSVSGNLKFDVAPPAPSPLLHALQQSLLAAPASPIIVCGSTVDGEEPLILDAFRQVLAAHPRAALVLAPRHPERFSAVASLITASGLPLLRRSTLAPAAAIPSLAGQVLLLDSIGELASLYSLATIAFVGGSLVPRGGHNILEPAHAGVPILVGPYTNNFREVIELFRSQDALLEVSPDTLAPTLLRLLATSTSGSPSVPAAASRQSFADRAHALVRQHSGATARTLDALAPLLESPPAAANSASSARSAAPGPQTSAPQTSAPPPRTLP